MNKEEAENFDTAVEPQHERVVGLLRSLGRVDAPSGFERRVMIRIADRRKEPRRVTLFPAALRYAVPLVAMLIVGILAFYVGLRPAETIVVEAPQSEPQVEQEIMPQQPEAPSQEVVQQEPEQSTERLVRMEERPTRAEGATDRNSNQGGSYDVTVDQDKPIMPLGIGTPQNDKPAKREDVIAGTLMSVPDVLSFIGISAEWNSGWRVKRVGTNSVGARSGVKEGDVVLALDDRKLSKDTTFKADVSASTLRVRRGTSEVTLKLK